MNKKYRIRTDLSVEHVNKILYRIERLKDNVLGGYIEGEKNLSQEGDCWVADDARVHGRASVYGDALVFGNAQVYGDARIYGNGRVRGDARVYGRADVYGNARVSGDVDVCGDARVYDNALVFGNSQVYDNARVYGSAIVSGNARVRGEAEISSEDKILTITCRPFNITITPQNVVVGCLIRPRIKGKVNAFLTVTEEESTKVNFPVEFRDRYKRLIRAGLKVVKLGGE